VQATHQLFAEAKRFSNYAKEICIVQKNAPLDASHSLVDALVFTEVLPTMVEVTKSYADSASDFEDIGEPDLDPFWEAAACIMERSTDLLVGDKREFTMIHFYYRIVNRLSELADKPKTKNNILAYKKRLQAKLGLCPTQMSSNTNMGVYPNTIKGELITTNCLFSSNPNGTCNVNDALQKGIPAGVVKEGRFVPLLMDSRTLAHSNSCSVTDENPVIRAKGALHLIGPAFSISSIERKCDGEWKLLHWD
jgi:hypothetical protein